MLNCIQGLPKLKQDKFLKGSSLGFYQHVEPHFCAQEFAGNYRGSLGAQMEAERAPRW